nr:MAG TPA: hypothetical protein [Caudoviricetes sp.]
MERCGSLLFRLLVFEDTLRLSFIFLKKGESHGRIGYSGKSNQGDYYRVPDSHRYKERREILAGRSGFRCAVS